MASNYFGAFLTSISFPLFAKEIFSIRTEHNLPDTVIARVTFFAFSLQTRTPWAVHLTVQLWPNNSYFLPTVWHVLIIITAKEHIPLTALNTYHPYLKVLMKTYRELNQFLQWAKWFSTQLLSVQHSLNFISNGRKMFTVAPIFPNNWTRQPITKRNHSNGFSMLLDKADCFQFSVNKMHHWNRHLSWIILLQWSKTMGYLWFCYFISSSTSRTVLVTASRVFVCCFGFLSFQFGF